MKPVEQTAVPNTTGRILHWAFRYDLLLWFASLGRERAFRQKILSLAKLRPGESVLDIGCGTGTLFGLENKKRARSFKAGNQKTVVRTAVTKMCERFPRLQSGCLGSLSKG
jgi:SAM-dependent methyltransferase